MHLRLRAAIVPSPFPIGGVIVKEFTKVVVIAALVAITLCLLGCGGHGGGGGDAGRKPQGYDANELAAKADVISKAAKLFHSIDF